MRMKKNILYPIIIIFGVMVFGTLAIIFVPAMFGSISASSDVDKYAGTESGQDTIRAVSGFDGLIVGVYAIPASPGFLALVLVGAVIVILIIFRLVVSGKSKGKKYGG